MKNKSIRTLIITLAVFLALGGTLLAVADRYWIAHPEPVPNQPVIPAPSPSSVSSPRPTQTAYSPSQTPAPTPEPTPAPTPSPVLSGDFLHEYEDEGVTIRVQKVETGEGQEMVTHFAAEVWVRDMTRLTTHFAKDTFGKNYLERPSPLSSRLGALFAVNGDFYGIRDDGIIIRNGVLYRDAAARQGAALCADGRLIVYEESEVTAVGLLTEGVRDSFSFGPILVRDGKAETEMKTNVRGLNPRTAIGMIEPGHFLFVVVDGRLKGYSRGMRMEELAGLMAGYGCQTAYNLDGGGTSTMIFDQTLVNRPLGKEKERSSSEIIYIK
ncbi:MAG: phosphodiester glycosidase family protein [Oscillospiraceae bacterium]|nr:phosphodiester glycosidase family protein [Oscillospiraceae bacterium]